MELSVRFAAATLLGAIACNAAEERTVADTPAVMRIGLQPSGGPAQHASTLSCTPTELSDNDTLLLSLPASHGPYLAVQAPDSTLYFVVFPTSGDSSPKARMSLMPSDSFVARRRLSLPVWKLRAVPWVFGRDTTEVVFARPGAYRVLVAHDLETDAPLLESCSLNYLGAGLADDR
jgi:hypothetical protein